jgi:hypothetical protein
MSQYNSFDIVTRLRDESQGSEVGFLQDLFYAASRFSLDPTHSPVLCIPGSFPEPQRPESEADHSLPSRADFHISLPDERL